MCVITPTPSPESLSAEHAPRCSMHPTAVNESLIVLCVRSPLREAMKPTPHASCSSNNCVLSTAPPSYVGHSPYTEPRSARHTVARPAPGARVDVHLGNAAALRNPKNEGVCACARASYIKPIRQSSSRTSHHAHCVPVRTNALYNRTTRPGRVDDAPINQSINQGA